MFTSRIVTLAKPELTNQYSINFDGANDYVNIDTVVGDIEGNNVGTISFWVNYVAGISGDSANIFTISDGSEAEYLQFNVDQLTTANGIRYHLTSSGTGADPTFVTSADYSGAWHHVVLTSDGSAYGLYIDGGTVGLATNTNNSGQWLNDLADLDSARIGGLRIEDAEKSFTGSIDEVAVFDKALSVSEVVLLYGGGSPADANEISGLVAYWRLEEGSGTSATDSSGNGYTGTLINSPIWSRKTPNLDPFENFRYLTFGGTDEYISVNDSNDFSFTNGSGADEEFSVSAWFFLPSSVTGMLITKYDGNDREWAINYNHTGTTMHVNLFNQGAGSNYIGRKYDVDGGDFSAYINKWVHIAVTYDASETSAGIKIYLDNVAVAILDAEAGSYTGMSNTSTKVAIGARFNSAPTVEIPWVGSVDEVAIFDKELSSGEVSSLYGGGTPQTTGNANSVSNLVAYWRFEEGVGDTVADSSTNSNTGTLTNMEDDATEWKAY